MRNSMLTGLLCALLCAPSMAQDSPKEDSVLIKVDKDLLIKDLLDQVAQSTGKALLYDPNSQRIRGQKLGTGFSHTVPKGRTFDTFRAILAFYELTLVPVGPRGHEIYLVIDSRSTNNFVKNRAVYVDHKKIDDYADSDGVYVACAIPVRHIENLTTLRTALSTMVSPAGIGRVHEVSGSQSIIVMDFAPNVAAMAHLIRQMDVKPDRPKPVLEVIELEHALAAELAKAVSAAIAAPPAPRQAVVRGRPVTYAAPRTIQARIVPVKPRNALVVSCDEDDLKRIRALVATLDRPAKDQEVVEVVRLEKAQAQSVANTLRMVFSKTRIVPDESTNSIVVATSKEIMERLKKVIKLLDQSPT